MVDNGGRDRDHSSSVLFNEPSGDVSLDKHRKNEGELPSSLRYENRIVTLKGPTSGSFRRIVFHEFL